MKRKPVFIGIGIVAMFAIVFNSFNQGKTNEQYIQELTNHRKKKNIDFQTGEDSPFKGKTGEFKGLNYYEPDGDFNVRAKFLEIADKKIRTLATSDNKKKQYLEYGYAKFDLEGKENKLLILEMVDDEFDSSLFLAFGDATSAIETYGAGRYLEVEHDGGKFITLDFNYAYNPYCAYSDNFSCPFPPKENLLSVPIKAGEKNYE